MTSGPRKLIDFPWKMSQRHQYLAAVNNNQIKGFPRGVITATLTPLNPNGTVDHAHLAVHCHSLVNHGGDGIALLGTTGEANSFSAEERRDILEQLIGSGFEPRRMIVGTGTCSLTETISLTKHAVAAGVGGILLMPPFFYRDVTDEGLFRYFASLIAMVGDNALRIYLYHFPRMSGIDMSLDLVARLKAEFPDIIAGMKDSCGDLAHMLRVMETIPDFEFYAGTEKYLADVVLDGGAGCISATTNYKVEAAAAVYKNLIEGVDHAKNEALMIAYRESFEGHNFAAALKGVLAKEQDLDMWNVLRPPLSALPAEEIDSVISRLNKVGV